MTDAKLLGRDLAPTASRAQRVTFFEDRAEVRRSAIVTVPQGRAELWIAGLSPFVDDASLRARVVRGAATVLAASVQRRSERERALSDEEIARLEAELDEARREVVRCSRAIERCNADADRAKTLGEHWLKALAEVPKGVGAEETARAWREAFDAIVARQEQAATRLAIERTASVEARRSHERAERALAQGRVERPKLVSLARVQYDASAEGELEIELVYRVPCALWRPEHTARLELDARGAASVQWTTAAVLWQRTGELWNDVELRFSTARPSRASAAPLAREEQLAWRKKTDHERHRVIVDVREQAVQSAGLDRGSRSVSEMPGVDDGGEPVVLAPKERVSVPSNGRPVRVEVLRATLEATVDRALYPERASAPHLRATLTWSGATPLLAGPLRVARGGSVVGRGRVAFVGQGAPFEVGFGPDDGLRVRRKVDESREIVPVLGTQKIRRTIRVFVSNLSGDPRSVKVVERVPLSEITDVEVLLGAHEGWRFRAQDAMLERDVELAPREGKELSFEYELRAGAKVLLPF